MRLRQPRPQPERRAVRRATTSCSAHARCSRRTAPLIGAAPDEFNSARDDSGHGTHTASTAAGNAGVEAAILGRDYGEISGIAPRARVIAYKGLGNLGGFTSDLAAAIDQAVADGVDVINYSVGSTTPSLLSGDGIAYLFAADAGVWVATSAGNSGPGAATIGSPASVPWITSVGASTQERFFEGTVELRSTLPDSGKGRGSGKTFSGASVTLGTDRALPLVDAASAGSDLCLRGDLDPAVVAGKIVLCRRGATGRAEKGLAVFEAGGAGMILYNNTDSDNLFTDTHWLPAVHVDNTDGVQIKAYIASQASADGADPDRRRRQVQGCAVHHVLLVTRREHRGARHHQARHHRPRSADPRRGQPVPRSGVDSAR